MKRIHLVLALLLLSGAVFAQNPAKETLLIHKCPDFTVTGKGDNPSWDKAAWNPLQKLDSGGLAYESKFKILYSATGLYILFNGDDQKITTSYEKDFEDLFKGDVFEVFLQPDPQVPLYVEYEVNALDKELVLLIQNSNGNISGWEPWHYEGKKKVIKKVVVTGGNALSGGSVASGQAIRSVSAELFFPYSLFNAMSTLPPVSGTVWDGNFFRLDYDSGKMIKWAWSPVERGFHEMRNFRPVRFE
ncbi:MAG TPA: carbohydrate-binding family 9-like protein [Puia sp.]|nr:carbohydrate-binding family 9-like protein [Puia sp.]